MHSDWLLPDWPAPATVRAVCTTRADGVSEPPYQSLNLGDHVGDSPVVVQQNRQRLAQTLGVRPVFMTQVHGTRALQLSAVPGDGVEADACWTQTPRLACTIMVADCLPVLLTDDSGTFVAAAHAGWRGLASGVIESLATQLKTHLRKEPNELLAWLGPCIGPGAYEVGEEVKAEFGQHIVAADRFFKASARSGKWLADLPGLAREQLRGIGVDRIHGNDGSPEWCTLGNPSRFFSHRRDRITGRMAACIWLDR